MAGAWVGQTLTFNAQGQYNASPLSIPTSSYAPLQVDGAGRLLVNIAAQGGVTVPSWYDSGALANSGVVKASPGSLLYIEAFNESTTKYWLMLFNATSVPSNGTTPVFQRPIVATSSTLMPSTLLDLRSSPRSFTQGISWAVSTSAVTLTLNVAAAPFWVNAAYQ